MSTVRDKRDAARAKLEARMAEKVERAKKRRRVQLSIITTIGVVVAAVAGFGIYKLVVHLNTPEPVPPPTLVGDGEPLDKVTIDTMTMTAPADVADGAAECAYVPAPAEQPNPNAVDAGVPEDGDQPNTGTQEMTLELNTGTVSFTIDNEKAPCTAASFTFLASQGFFDKTECHRLTTENLFVLQCGDPSGTGMGGPTYSFANEHEPEDTAEELSEEDLAAGKTPPPNYPAGSIAMANSGVDTNGSQFFIVYEDTYLPPNYTLFGEVSEGLDVIRDIAEKGAVESR
ncbi:peptidylprolyl isomerase [Stackebrandtia soli]|uniref:peptidylprolyl isomerase n=1 Tax=Stackebrandtia soli TaxID=1892856 RepID=UPI0039E76681